jgi:plasmid stabilization system protein ParE
VNAVIRPRARDDIIRQFRWYLVEQDSADAAYRFLDALEESVRQLLSMPHMGSPRALKNRHLEGLRAWPVKDRFIALPAENCFVIQDSKSAIYSG